MVEKIRLLCKGNKTSITKLEQALGFGNGTIGKWKNGVAPNLARVQAIADYFGVSVAYLTGTEQKNAPATQTGSESEVDMKLREFAMSASTEELQELNNYIEFIKSKRK